MLALRNACGNLKQLHLDGCVLYTSAEPCPMCYAASLWAHIDKVYYAATYDDAKKYGEFEDADFMKEMTQPAESKTMKVLCLPCVLREGEQLGGGRQSWRRGEENGRNGDDKWMVMMRSCGLTGGGLPPRPSQLPRSHAILLLPWAMLAFTAGAFHA